jgi:hypothetical protein
MIFVLKLVVGFMIGKIMAKLALTGQLSFVAAFALSIVTTILICGLVDRLAKNG